MTSYITTIIRDPQEVTSNILDIPADYPVYRIIEDLIEGIGLDITDQNSQVLRYYLTRKRDNKRMLPSTTLAQARILRGEVFIISHTIPQELIFNRNIAASYRRASMNFSNTPRLLEAQRLQAAGAYGKALAILLNLWATRFQKQRGATAELSDVTITLNQLGAYINELFMRFIQDQLELVDFESFFETLQVDEAQLFFREHPNYSALCVDALMTVSDKLAQQQDYTHAHEAAILALQLDPENAQATALANLAHTYTIMLACEDSEERLDLALAIAEANPRYGKIQQDLLQLRQHIHEAGYWPQSLDSHPANALQATGNLPPWNNMNQTLLEVNQAGTSYYANSARPAFNLTALLTGGIVLGLALLIVTFIVLSAR
ncbi:MAG TPA: EsaB/YukD family protein [Chloroflexia bacterium]|nr:EsaB/YukD family protein [Chloroflexia bacterium]